MELTALLERMKMEHLLAQLDGVCEHAAKTHLPTALRAERAPTLRTLAPGQVGRTSWSNRPLRRRLPIRLPRTRRNNEREAH